MSVRYLPRAARLSVVLLSTICFPGCDRSDDTKTVTLYCSVDPQFVPQVVKAFEEETGIAVRLKTDQEAGKTTGLVNTLRAERDRPQADVFWSSELFNTILLARDGMLAEYRPPAEGIPDRYKDPAGHWTAFGVRTRVVAYNTEKVSPNDVPLKWRDIADPRWTGQLGVANPVFGTTRGHFAAFLALWGEDEYVAYLEQLNQTIRGKLHIGNADAARFVGRGDIMLCATDTDDVYARQAHDEPVGMVYPDMGDGGTLLIPNSVAIIRGAPHPEAARKLVDFLTSAQTERMLAESESRNIPVRESLRTELGMDWPAETKVGFDVIADAMPRAIELASRHLGQ